MNKTLSEKYNQKDENGKEHGEWIWYYANGQLSRRINFFHGVEHGFFLSLWYDGQIVGRGYYHMGVKVGYWQKFQTKENFFLNLI